ncbi:MAG: 30S ribosomal protein S12 methylthiotransferase RimO, partial [Candidatus Eremiobacteraeota bacterium]|nr:30S ribosomal protein S12 methylthiotransferase RimO [Candidatus Eremiobacteraeota bacterium]
MSLGCAKNLVDTEVMIAALASKGWQLESDADRADTVVINTCAFIDPAKAESTQAILDQATRKQPGQQLIVAGCLAQRYGTQLQTLIPEIDGIVGTGAYAGIAEVLEEAQAGRAPVRLHFDAEPVHDFLPRLVTTPRATAYLKIAEGCDHPCTFCIIPTLRGGFRSRALDSICAEARALVQGGAKELILIAQDTSMWGRDLGLRRGGLAHLLERLHEIEGLEWIRLLYLYPATVDDELISAIATLPKVCKYMDMPLQHVHPDVLRAMRRPSNGERYLQLIEEFRARVPEITMRSTFIVGFPGERDEHAAYLEEWIGRARLDRVGFFEYSAEEGTPAAELPNSVAVRKRRERLIRLREAARVASEAARRARCGRTVRVLAEESHYLREYDEARRRLNVTRAWFGRSEGEAPGVDGGIYFTGGAFAGGFSDVHLTEHGAFDFF